VPGSRLPGNNRPFSSRSAILRVRLRSISAGARRGSSAGIGAVEETSDLGVWADVFMHKDYDEH
jgi:hypothetical protein